MSQNETYFGRIEKINYKDKEDWCRRTCETFYNLTSDDLEKDEDWFDKFREVNDRKQWMILNNEVYAVYELVEFDEGGDIFINKLPDDSIIFFTTFYNGGTYLEEVVEEELKRLNL